jgi:hypothetical protein
VNATAKQQLRRNVANDPYSNPTKLYSIPSTTNEDGTINIPAQAVFGIDPNHEPIDAYMAVRTVPGGVITSQASGGTAINATQIIVPAGKKWTVLSFVADVTATATVGNRILQLNISTGAGAALWRGAASTAVTAAQIGGYDVGFGAPINTPSTTVRRALIAAANTNVQVRESCALNQWAAGYNIVLNDSAGIDNADSVAWRIVYVEYDA